MGRRTLTDAEVRAYEELAAAACKLQAAQREAEAARLRAGKTATGLSITKMHAGPDDDEEADGG
jgi:hypothetical protein